MSYTLTALGRARIERLLDRTEEQINRARADAMEAAFNDDREAEKKADARLEKLQRKYERLTESHLGWAVRYCEVG